MRFSNKDVTLLVRQLDNQTHEFGVFDRRYATPKQLISHLASVRKAQDRKRIKRKTQNSQH